MSFGYSAGDFIAVGQLAWNVYKSCRDAPESFNNISLEVLSLHAVLKSVEESLACQVLSKSRQENLETISSGCQKALQDLQALVDQYESLGTKSKRTFDRIRWGTNDIAELRARLTSNIIMLNTFLSTSQEVVEKKLNKLIQEFKDGKREGSIMTVATIESISTDDKKTWRAIRKELEDIGISVAAFDANKAFIMVWFQAAIANGSFEEEVLDDENEDMCELESLTEALNISSSSGIPTEECCRGMASNSSDDPLKALPSSKPEAVTEAKELQRADAKASPANAISGALDRRPYPASPVLAKKKVPRVVPLVAWMLRYNVSFLESCERGDISTAQRLLDKGANINARGRYGTAIYRAWRRRDLNVMRWLLEHGAEGQDFLFSDSLGYEDFAAAELLLQYGANINYYDLRHYSREGNTKVVRFLLEHGASVDSTEPFPTALYDAIQGGHEMIVQDLLDHGAGMEKGRLKGAESAVNQAISMGFDQIATRLIQAGAELPVEVGSDRLNPILLRLAVSNGCIATVPLLIAKGWNVNQTDIFGLTLLDHAVRAGNPRMVERLLEEGATVDYQSRLSVLSRFPNILDGYELFKPMLRKYPHPARNPQTLYSGDH